MKKVFYSSICSMALLCASYSNANSEPDFNELQLTDVEALSQTTIWEHPEIEVISEPHNYPGYAGLYGSSWFWEDCDWGHGHCLTGCPARFH